MTKGAQCCKLFGNIETTFMVSTCENSAVVYKDGTIVIVRNLYYCLGLFFKLSIISL